jgi:CheY-like chemotaxis protein
MDMRMPIMNGYDATRKIREQENGTDVVIVALTAKAFESERREVLAAGCDDYVAKPFRQQALFEKVKSHLDIEYIYEEQDIDALDLLDNTQLSLSTSLMLIDEELQHNLRKAAERYSLTDVLAVTEKIALQDKMLAEQIAQLARNFDFGRILHGLYS